MAKNNKYWKKVLASSEDRKFAEDSGDPLEEGLERLSWHENSKRIIKNSIKKTQETFGEEVGNSITAGVMALYLLCVIPYASIVAYNRVEEGKIMSVMGMSAFLITFFLSLLFSTVYHFMKRGTPHKRVMSKLNRILCYFAVLGVYTPICINFLGTISGPVIFALEAAIALAGVFVTAFCYKTNKIGTAISNILFVLQGWLILPLIGVFYQKASHLTFWLIVSGAIVYTIGMLFFSSGKRFKFSHMVWHFFVLIGGALHILGIVYFFA